MQINVSRATAPKRGNRGESLVEVLVAIMVSGLAILMLATVISVAASTIERSREAMDDYFAAANKVAAASSVDAEGAVRFTTESGDEVYLSDEAVTVEYTVSNETPNNPVVFYQEEE